MNKNYQNYTTANLSKVSVGYDKNFTWNSGIAMKPDSTCKDTNIL